MALARPAGEIKLRLRRVIELAARAEPFRLVTPDDSGATAHTMPLDARQARSAYTLASAAEHLVK